MGVAAWRKSVRPAVRLDWIRPETEAMRPADLGGTSRLYTPSTPDDLSCYEELQDRAKIGNNFVGHGTQKAADEPETEARWRAVTEIYEIRITINSRPHKKHTQLNYFIENTS